MNKNCSKPLYSSIVNSLLLLITVAGPVSAEPINLRPFSASYDLYRGSSHVASAKLSLQPQGHTWRWKMTTKARGIYAWFSKKRPYTETTFSVDAADIRVQEIVVADARSERRREIARFDWGNGKLQVKRKGKHREYRLNGAVYDYQSIHLLAAAMNRQRLEQSTSDFYRKGKLVESRLIYSGQQSLTIDGVPRQAHVYELLIVNSDSKVRYFYDVKTPLLPLRIEKLDGDKSPNTLKLRKVDWLS